MDQERIELSSKRGKPMLSTCLASLEVFVQRPRRKLPYTVVALFPAKVSPTPRDCRRLFPIYVHRLTHEPRNNGFGAMSRPDTLCPDKARFTMLRSSSESVFAFCPLSNPVWPGLFCNALQNCDFFFIQKRGRIINMTVMHSVGHKFGADMGPLRQEVLCRIM